MNIRDFSLQTSEDGTVWTTLQTVQGNEAEVTDLDIKEVSAKHVKIVIDHPGSDSTARIAEVEIFGRRP